MDEKYTIKSEEELKNFYDPPIDRAIKKQKTELDEPSREFILNSPFLCLATTNPNASTDCSPKGDAPGFVKILNNKTIIIPDRKGNNRLDGLINILHDSRVGILFMIPGRNETLRVNGHAKLSINPKWLNEFEVKGKNPKVVIVVNIEEVYLHCPKAFVRSSLWQRGAERVPDIKTYIRASRKQLGVDLSEEEILKLANEYEDAFEDTLY